MAETRRALNAIDRLSEILFGLIMVLTFTGSLSIAEAGRDDVRTMLIGALGCNIAWGVIDAILFLMGALAERSESLACWHAARKAADPAAARQLVADALPPIVASVLTDGELDTLRQRLAAVPNPPKVAQLDRSAWRGAFGVFVLVVVTTFPVVVPFLFAGDAQLALRLSNGIAIAMLFLTGYAFARLTGRQPWLVGVLMVVLGVALVGITMALGG
ncbi:MAG TPA: VIT1/CCC1 transporter family protein [Vicinamibacterales bacterium]|nr:VIT1/CCC1 transporter family protein [Vicinamibacterales bacterium]